MSRLQALAAALDSNRFTRKELADGTGVLIDLERMRVLTLNETGMFLLQQIVSGAASSAGLEERLTSAFAVDAETAHQDIEELLGDLERLFRDQES